ISRVFNGTWIFSSKPSPKIRGIVQLLKKGITVDASNIRMYSANILRFSKYEIVCVVVFDRNNYQNQP
ncbi:14907_t:CDS:1, partial [Funneliformis geosporum]